MTCPTYFDTILRAAKRSVSPTCLQAARCMDGSPITTRFKPKRCSLRPAKRNAATTHGGLMPTALLLKQTLRFLKVTPDGHRIARHQKFPPPAGGLNLMPACSGSIRIQFIFQHHARRIHCAALLRRAWRLRNFCHYQLGGTARQAYYLGAGLALDRADPGEDSFGSLSYLNNQFYPFLGAQSLQTSGKRPVLRRPVFS